MRMLLNIDFPHEEFNAAVRDGSAGKKLSLILEELKPEAVYFTEQNGHRSAVMIVEVAEPSRIPSLAEPFFLLFNANVRLRVVMSPGELERAGIEALGKKWSGR